MTTPPDDQQAPGVPSPPGPPAPPATRSVGGLRPALVFGVVAATIELGIVLALVYC